MVTLSAEKIRLVKNHLRPNTEKNELKTDFQSVTAERNTGSIS